MVDPHITLDPNGLSPVEQKLRGPLEEQLTSAFQAATDKVQQQYDGEPVEQVSQEILKQTRSGLHPDIAAGFTPDPTQLRQVAEAVIQQDQAH